MASRFFGSELALYPDKTKFILFNPSRKQINPDHSIFIDGNKITIVEQTKFFGFIMAASYKRSSQLLKFAKSIGIIVQLRQFFLTETLVTLYNLHIYSTVLLFGPLLSQ